MIKFEMYTINSKIRSLFFYMVISIAVYVQANKINQFFAIIFTLSFFTILTMKLLTKKLFLLDPGKDNLEMTTEILGIIIKRHRIDLTKYYGVRNRLSWAFGKQCVTELVTRTGETFKIRIELMTYQITEEARIFVKDFIKQTGMPELREFN